MGSSCNQVTAPVRYLPELVQGHRHTPVIAVGASDGQRLGGQLLGSINIILVAGELSGPAERVGAGLRQRGTVERHGAVEPGAALGDVAEDDPEPSEVGRQALRNLSVLAFDRPTKRGAQVIVLAGDSLPGSRPGAPSKAMQASETRVRK